MDTGKINLLFFGITHDIADSREQIWEIGSDTTVKQLKEQLEEKFPGFKELKSFAIAVNEEYASEDQTLRDRDEVAIIPPVSGG